MTGSHATTHPAHSLLLALDMMRTRGHGAVECLKGTGLSTGDLAQEGRTVTLRQETAFYRNLMRLTGDPCIGLAIGQTYLPQRYGLFGYALLSAATVEQALAIAVSIGHHMTFTWFQMGYTIAGDCVRFEFCDRGLLEPDVRDMYFDRDCAAFCVASEEILRQRLNLTGVRLPHDGHRHRERYEAFFGCPVTFGHPSAVLEAPSSIMDAPLPFSDELVSKRLTGQCKLLLSRFHRSGRMIEEVRQVLVGKPGHYPGLEGVAEALHMSVRTLRRRLREEGATYQSILDEVRFSLAREYLLETSLPLNEISRLLGYSEPNNFTHAFKRWAGIGPYAYRKGRADVTGD
jgi:AraC-like DNA-binding protein